MSDGYYSDDFEEDEPTPRAPPPSKPAPAAKAKPAPAKAASTRKASAPATAPKKPLPARGPSGVGSKGGGKPAAGGGGGSKAPPKPAPPPKEPTSDDELEAFLNDMTDSDEDGESLQEVLRRRREGAEALAKQRVADRAVGIEPRRLKTKEEWEAEKKKKAKKEKERAELKRRRAAAGEVGQKVTLKEERDRLREEKQGAYIDKLLGKMVKELEEEFDGGHMAAGHIIDLVLDEVVKKGELELMLRAMEEQQDAIDREARSFAEDAFRSDDWQSGVRSGVYAREAYKRKENRVDALDRFDADEALYGNLSPSRSPMPMVDSLDSEHGGGGGGEYAGVKHYDDSLDAVSQRVSSNMSRYVNL